MTWVEVIGAAFQIILWILGAVKESNDESKKLKVEIIADATKAVVNRDATGYSLALDRILRMR